MPFRLVGRVHHTGVRGVACGGQQIRADRDEHTECDSFACVFPAHANKHTWLFEGVCACVCVARKRHACARESTGIIELSFRGQPHDRLKQINSFTQWPKMKLSTAAGQVRKAYIELGVGWCACYWQINAQA